MSSGNLFDMELEWREEKDEIEFDTPTLFEEMEKEIKEFLLDQQVEGDSTDGAFDFLDNLTIGYKKNLTKLLERTMTKKVLSNH